MSLSEQQKNEVRLILGAGCDRETAAQYIGCEAVELTAAALLDPVFGSEMRRAEAGCELSHMRNVQQASRDPRHWRSSVWWLERRSPERFGARRPGAISPGELADFMERVAAVIAEAIPNDGDRKAVLGRIDQIAERANSSAVLDLALGATVEEEA